MRAIKRYIARQSFEPGCVGWITNPFFLARRALAREIRDLGQFVRGRTIDVGCGQKPYRHLFASTQYLGVELDTPENRARKLADVYYAGKALPFPDNEFDSVVSNQVLEHVPEPAFFISELHRILRPDGVLLVSVPFVWDEHEQPNDFYRYSSFGLRYLVKRAGFEVIVERRTLANVGVIFQLGAAYGYKLGRRWGRWGGIAATLIICAPLNLMGWILGRILPGNSDLFLDNIMLLRKPPDRSPA